MDPLEGSSQGRLAFNNQPCESIRAASLSVSPAYSAREDFFGKHRELVLLLIEKKQLGNMFLGFQENKVQT